MITPLDELAAFATPTHAEGILASCDGASAHTSWPATLGGVKRTADELAGVEFPRSELAAILAEYNRSLGAPEAAIANAERLASSETLVVTTGQQPCAGLGPLYVLYKAVTAVKLAREAERELGAPVVPVFWNASEDHDIDEVAGASAPLRDGTIASFKADLERWRGRSVASIDGGAEWRGAYCEWFASLDSSDGTADDDATRSLDPGSDEGWARWFSRGLSSILGGAGLVMLEPQLLRPLSSAIYARAIRDHRRVQSLLRESCDERSDRERECSFTSIDGPPVFVERDSVRRRVHASGDRFVLRGSEDSFSVEELVDLATRAPHVFSSHASLRPVVQNALLPVVAAVLGPGEIAYHEELLRFHRSEIGANRRMPALWPRASLTVLDDASRKTAGRFGMKLADVFVDREQLLERFTPKGELSASIREIARATAERLEAAAESVLALDGTLSRPLKKTVDSVSRSLKTFSDKVQRAEAGVQGFAPDKLKRLSAFVRPGGRSQERTFCTAWAMSRFGARLVDELLSSLDIHDRRHKILTPD